MAGQPRRIGRPTNPPAPGKRASLGLKVTNDTKQRLDAAARANGRTQSQEAEARLERSFLDEDLLPQLLQLAYGRQLAGLLLTLGDVMRDAGTHGAIVSTGFPGAGRWFDDPIAYSGATTAAKAALDEFRLDINSADAEKVETVRHLGEQCAHNYLQLLRYPELGESDGEWSAPIRSLLGPALARIAPDNPLQAAQPSAKRKGSRQ